MQDQQPTSHPDADTEANQPLDPTAPANANGTLTVSAFDPDAFEEAAAQFRPSWDDIDSERLSSDVIAAEFETRPVAPAPIPSEPFVVRGTGETDALPAEVVVPRPPRTPQLNYAGMRTHDGDDLSITLPKKSLRGVWVTAAVFTFAAILAFALTRRVDEPSATPLVKAPVREVTSQAAKPETVPPAPARVEIPKPQAAAEVVTPEPPAPPVEVIAPAPAPKAIQPVRTTSAATRTRAEKAARASKTKRPITAQPASPKKPKRGAGFVSTNPY